VATIKCLLEKTIARELSGNGYGVCVSACPRSPGDVRWQPDKQEEHHVTTAA
jgi:hypothetical protein